VNKPTKEKGTETVTTPNDKPMWERHCLSHPRFRRECLTDESIRRRLENLHRGANQDEDQFHDLLDTTYDVALDLAGGDIEKVVANHLKPKPREKWKAPELPAIDGITIQNPYVEGGSELDRKTLEKKLALAKQEAESDPRDIIAQAEFARWSEIVTHLKRSATEPATYALEKAEEEARRAKWNFALENYDHSKNAYATGVGVAEFANSIEPELKPLYRALAQPVSLPLFGAREEQYRTLLVRLSFIGGKTWAAIKAAQKRELDLRDQEAKRYEAQRHEDALAFERQRQAHEDLMRGIKHLPDGRTLTLPRQHA
jgi:hypothetical protein